MAVVSIALPESALEHLSMFSKETAISSVMYPRVEPRTFDLMIMALRLRTFTSQLDCRQSDNGIGWSKVG